MRVVPVLAALCSLLLSPTTGTAQVVLVAGFFDSSIQRYDITGVPQTPLIAPGGVATPAAMTLSPDNSALYVASQSTDQVLRFNPTTGAALGSFSLPAGSQPAGMKFGPDGNLYISLFGAGVVNKYNPLTGALAGSVLTGLGGPSGLAFSGNTVYVADLGGGSVQRANSDGTGQNIIVTPGSGGLQTPKSVTFGPAGALYVSDFFGSAIRKYDPLGVAGSNSLGDFYAGPELANQFPSDVIFQDGLAWVGNFGPTQGAPIGTVKRFNGLTGAFVDTFASGIFSASALTITPVPEPSALILLGTAFGFAAWRRRA